MNKQTTLIQATVAALLLAVGLAYAAPQEIVKLPRVVITGKATPAATMNFLPRVVVTGKSTPEQVAEVKVLPRVVVTGVSLNTQMQRQMFAAARPTVRAL